MRNSTRIAETRTADRSIGVASSRFGMLALCALALTGCGEKNASAKEKPAHSAAQVADNTARNARDADGATKTPLDQGQHRPDLEITADIRKRVLDKDVSFNADNVKIITTNGQVTLRGPVNTQAEKQLIEQIARDVAGASNVVSELEVAPH